jgi:hypothetical protein
MKLYKAEYSGSILSEPELAEYTPQNIGEEVILLEGEFCPHCYDDNKVVLIEKCSAQRCPWGPYVDSQGCAESLEKGFCNTECQY